MEAEIIGGSMQKWEYRREPTSRDMAELGEKGWELVSVDSSIAFFKRPLGEISVELPEKYRDCNNCKYTNIDFTMEPCAKCCEDAKYICWEPK